MMKHYFTAFSLFFLFACSQSGPAKTDAAATPAAPPSNPAVTYQMSPDTVEVRGKFLTGCKATSNLKIAIHGVDNTFWKEVKVEPNGEFRYKFFLNEPRRVALRTMYGNKVDFFTTTKEKVYTVEINCDGRDETFAVKGSAENDAYMAFTGFNKQFQSDLDTLAKQNLPGEALFSALKPVIETYQQNISAIAAKHPGTFTAQIFCTAEKLQDGSLNSLESLRKNFLKRDAYGNPQFYNDFLPQRILMNFIAIREKDKDADEAVETLMSVALQNKEAAKRLQDNMSSIFYKMYQEDLVIAYIKWAERNPDKMYNASVKQRLNDLKRVVAGNPMIDFELKDPKGNPQKLSATVKSGKLTVLVFYGPTCGHCKEKVPQLIPLWDEYKSKGLKIFAVASDSKPEEWTNFITAYAKPEWVHVFNPKESGVSPSDMYHAANPTFVLIDGEGKIVSRIANFEEVKSKIIASLK